MLRPHGLMLGSLVLFASISLTDIVAFADQTVVVVIDDSGSMKQVMQTKQRRIEAAKQALATVLKAVEPGTQVGILALNSQVNNSHWIVPVGTPNPERWQRPLEKLHAEGGTPLGQWMRQGADELLALRAKQPFSTYRLLVVTDGEATDAQLLYELLPDLLSRGINLDVIGVDMQEDHSLARIAHSYRRAGDQTALAQAMREVFAETVGDDQSSQADFEMLSGLSDEAAAAIVAGLTTQRNEPLQVIARDPSMPAPAGLPIGSANNPASGKSFVATIFGTLCCFGIFGVTMLVVAAGLLRVIKNKSRS